MYSASRNIDQALCLQDGVYQSLKNRIETGFYRTFLRKYGQQPFG
jgi:hypothetical protein